MKKALSLILCLCLLLPIFSACSRNGDETPQQPPTEEVPPEEEVIFPALDNDFRSRRETIYKNINGKDVTVYTMFREPDDGWNNPNFAQAVMLRQCTNYKIANPKERVVATFSTFHLSVYAAACLDPESEEYGRMKNLYDKEYDEESGYYRVSWLMIDAARHGVDMTVIGDLDASPTNGRVDGNYYKYFTGYLSKNSLISGKKISDFLTFRRADWTSYGDKAATDMMHLKLCTVSHRLGNDGKSKGPAVWVGSINLDGVSEEGINSHNSIQSGVVVTNHEELRRVAVNYVNVLKDYCGQEDVTAFRDLIISRTTEQVALLKAGEGDQIPADEQIIYLGTEKDSVFELYFTPFGGTQNKWDLDHNPFCRYLAKLLTCVDGEHAIQLIWNNVKYKQTFGLADTMASVIANAFLKNAHPEDILLLQLPQLKTEYFNGLPESDTIRVNKTERNYHTKDLQFSYVEDGERQWVVIYNTLNMHEGSMAYQSNLVLVVKENEQTGNNFYTDYAILSSPGVDFEKYRVAAK